jgi:sterol desaturase/sphingolipid hydroxylase (fatty acid hydroxylase superfamily)
MENQNNQPVRTVDWVLTLLITAIPLVGFVMLFVWAFGNNTNPSKANWAKATLVWIAMAIAVYIIFAVIFGAAFLFHSFQ